MRKQYHFRNSSDGLCAWYIDKLILLTEGMSAEEIPLSAIRELDEPYWYDSGDDPPTCRSIADHMRLVQAADLVYPIIVCPEGRVMDGMHRVAKALLQGRNGIMAYRLPALPEPDYVNVDPVDLPYGDPVKLAARQPPRAASGGAHR